MENSPFSFPEHLQFQRTKILNLTECKHSFAELSERYTGMPVNKMIARLGINNICTINQENEGLCFGDLGNALVSKDGKLIAVSSWASHNGQDLPDVFTKTYPYLRWIRDEMNKMLKKSKGKDSVEHVEKPKLFLTIFYDIRDKILDLF